MSARPVEIVCPACKAEALLMREPVYEGFRKKGERLLCSACGHEFPDESSVPFKREKKPGIFTEEDRPAKLDVFSDDERGRTCRYCANYTVNPFTQRCGLTWRIVEATDTCEKFVRRQERAGSGGDGGNSSDS